MKTRLFILFLSSTFWCIGQEVKVEYLDSLLMPSDEVSASFYQETIKTDNQNYQRNSYYLPSKKIKRSATCLDSNCLKYVGYALEFFESGKLKDSSFSNKNGKMLYSYSFYESGILQSKQFNGGGNNFELFDYYESGAKRVYVYQKDGMKDCEVIGYDENGQVIPNYIFQKAAEFDGGKEGWVSFLQNHLRSNTPEKNKAPAGRYKVMLNFLVDKNGKVSMARVENDPGFGTKEEALRVINKSPRWKPAIQYNEPVKYRARQPITFVVEPAESQNVSVIIEPEFVGGRVAWSEYLKNNLKVNLPSDNGAPNGRYAVILSFLIDVDGSVLDVSAENNPGYGSKEEAIRIMRGSPRWKPAIENGKPIKHRMRQTLTFVVNN